MKYLRIFFACVLFALLATATFAQNKTVQVVMPEAVNLSGSEAAWLPGQIQDKLKSNLQEYLGMKTVVDSKSEATLKKLQREAEDGGRDENTAIELGKISTAQFAVLTKIRKTGKGYTISVDYTDMTTGVQKATAASKEYKATDELYGSTGAIDEITLILAEKLNIAISSVQKQSLRTGTADFTLEDQLALAKQNEENYKKLMQGFDEQIRALSVSNDLNAAENTKKIEAEKALLAEKQKSEQKRRAELEAQKKQADADAQLEAERSAEQRKKRDELSSEAAKKAAEVRKLKMEKQGVFGQINVIESKKKALVEIREGVENRIRELYEQLQKDKEAEEDRIRNKSWSSVELENGKPTQAAQRRRDNQVNESNGKLTLKFIADAKAVQKAASKQDSDLLAEIRADQKDIGKTRTVSSMGSELKVSYGSYSGEKKGWNVYLSLYPDGIELTSLSLLLTYKAVTGKDAPNMETSSNEAVQEYSDTVDMYNSLLLRGDPIFYYEIDYTVSALPDEQPSAYSFVLKEVRTVSTLKNNVIQKNPMTNTIARTMTPQWNIHKEDILALFLVDEEVRLAEYVAHPEKGVLFSQVPYVIQNLKNDAKIKVTGEVPTRKKNEDSKYFYNDFSSIANALKESKVNIYLDLASVTLHKSDIYGFENCTRLVGITLPKDAKWIPSYAFEGCTQLASITIPASVTSISLYAFENCTSLKTVNYCGSKKQWKAIKIDKDGNKPLLKAKINYDYKGE